jgi:predicted DNA-binding mobile mystery protein A
MKHQNLLVQQTDSALRAWRNLPAPPSGGWLRAVREALGLTTRQAAARAGIGQSAWVAAEQGEASGTITLNHLRKLAAALGCTVQHAFVSSEPLAQRVTAQARAVATKRVREAAHTMRLEAQGTDPAFEQTQINELTDELLRQRWSALWK